MAGGRIRSLKPEIAHDVAFGTLSVEQRLLFVLLLTVADDFGLFEADPRYLKAKCFPYDNGQIDVGSMLKALHDSRLIVLYDMNRPYGWIRNWLKHQRIDRPGHPACPPPVDLPEFDRSLDEYSTSHRRILVEHSSSVRRAIDEHSTGVRRVLDKDWSREERRGEPEGGPSGARRGAPRTDEAAGAGAPEGAVEPKGPTPRSKKSARAKKAAPRSAAPPLSRAHSGTPLPPAPAKPGGTPVSGSCAGRGNLHDGGGGGRECPACHEPASPPAPLAPPAPAGKVTAKEAAAILLDTWRLAAEEAAAQFPEGNRWVQMGSTKELGAGWDRVKRMLANHDGDRREFLVEICDGFRSLVYDRWWNTENDSPTIYRALDERRWDERVNKGKHIKAERDREDQENLELQKRIAQAPVGPQRTSPPPDQDVPLQPGIVTFDDALKDL